MINLDFQDIARKGVAFYEIYIYNTKIKFIPFTPQFQCHNNKCIRNITMLDYKKYLKAVL